MCGRFTLTVNHLAQVAGQLDAWLEPSHAESYRPRFNVAPTDRHWIVREQAGRRELIPAEWGLINPWARGKAHAARPINLRAETLATKPGFRDAYRSRRCIVPADGFYEWRGAKGDREPIWFHAPDRALIWLAGLYQCSTDPKAGESHETFAIVTTRANELVAPIHDRMPVMIELADVRTWLEASTKDASELVAPVPSKRLVASLASRRVNSTDHDDPDLLDPFDPRARRQLNLFGSPR
jgi:putative SOS response-associated peptidase YedK